MAANAGAVFRCYRLSVWLHTASLLLSGDVPVVLRDLIALLGDVLRQLVGHRHRAVVAAGAADGDDQGGLAILGVQGRRKVSIFSSCSMKSLVWRKENTKSRPPIQTRLVLQLRHIVGVGHKAHVEHQIRLDGDARA